MQSPKEESPRGIIVGAVVDIEALIEGLPERLSLLKNEVTGKGASPRQVSEVEEIVGVRFPNSFVAFLCKYGWADLEYLELYGFGDDVPERLDLVRNTRRGRQQAQSAIPQHLIPVMRDGAGNSYCLDCRALDDNDECPVVFWEHELGTDQTPEFVGEDYLSWLQDELDEILADD